MTKVTEDQVHKIYNQAWYSGESCATIGKKYGISDSCVEAIKNGHSWSQITEHIKGNNKDKIFNATERKTLKTAFDKAVITKYAGMMALDEFYVQLIDEDVENATEFKVLFRQYLTEKGLRGLRFPREEVQEFYERFKNGMIKNDSI